MLYLSSIAHCHTKLKEHSNDKALHIPKIDLETNHDSLEDQALNLNNTGSDKSYRTEEGQAKKALCSDQKPADLETASIAPADGEPAGIVPAGEAPADGGPADGQPADRGAAESVSDQYLREEAHNKAGNESQGATKINAMEQTEEDFPLCFDETLERLLEACNLPSNQLENPIHTSRMSECSDQFQDRDEVDGNFKANNVSKLEQNPAPNSQSINFCSERSKRGLGLQSSSLTIANNTTYSASSPLDGDTGNHSTALARIGRRSESPTEVSARSISKHEADVHMSILRHGRQHPTKSHRVLSGDAWRSYRNLYEGQILPLVEAGSNKYDFSDVGSRFDRRGGTWPTHQTASVKDETLEDFQVIDACSQSHSPHNPWDNPESYDDGNRDRQPNYYPLDGESQNCRDLDYGDAINVLEDNSLTPAFSFGATKRTEMPSETFDSPNVRNMATSAMSTDHYGVDDIPNDQQRLDHDESCDAYWAGFWRPNKLY
ncbi:MAG: hypothetical protein Q9195_004428 [Heterodermia aff. obscurata]